MIRKDTKCQLLFTNVILRKLCGVLLGEVSLALACHYFSCASCLILSLWIEKQIFLHYVRIAGSAGWFGVTRADSGRLSDVGSSINWVRIVWGELFRIGLEGKYCDSTLSMSGITLALVSDVALHLVNRWVMSSVGGGWVGEYNWQRRHAVLSPYRKAWQG